MSNNTKFVLAATLIAALATPALAADEWTVDSGRYVNGQVPSYTTLHAAPGLIERRNAAVIEDKGSPSSRNAMVQSN